MAKKRVLICDDQPKFIEDFRKNHGSYYEVMVISDIRDVIERLHDMKKLPDLVLLDLFHPISDDTEYSKKIEIAEQELEKLRQQIENTKQAVNAAWQPLGIDILRDIRREYKSQRLPIIIYSQTGQILLDEEKIRIFEECEGHWLIKNQCGPRTEKTRMDRITNYKFRATQLHATKILKFYKIGFISVSSVLVAVLSYKYLPLNQLESIIGGLFLGMMSSIIAFFLTRIYEGHN